MRERCKAPGNGSATELEIVVREALVGFVFKWVHVLRSHVLRSTCMTTVGPVYAACVRWSVTGLQSFLECPMKFFCCFYVIVLFSCWHSHELDLLLRVLFLVCVFMFNCFAVVHGIRTTE